MLESDLYAPLKCHLEGLGWEVRAEVNNCDAVAMRDGEILAIELKVAFGLPVLYQAMDRMSASDNVMVIVGVPEGRKARANWDTQVPKALRLCRMMGIGLGEVRNGNVHIHVEPGPYAPRKNTKMRGRLVKEFSGRSGDHNLGGTTRRPRVTAYRENALRVARLLVAGGPMAPVQVKRETGIEKATGILSGNVYGWFERLRKGVYGITLAGMDGLAEFKDVVDTQKATEANRVRQAA